MQERKKIKSELIETLAKAYSLGRVWLGRWEDWGSPGDPTGDFKEMVLMVKLQNAIVRYTYLGQHLSHHMEIAWFLDCGCLQGRDIPPTLDPL